MSLLDELEGSIEEEKQLSAKEDECLLSMVERLEEEFEMFDKWYMDRWKHSDGVVKNFMKAFEWNPALSLNPVLIESFLDKNNRHFKKNSSIAEFMTMLIQSAYDDAHNDFYLPLLKGEGENAWAYSYLAGRVDDPIRITLNDNEIWDCCRGLKKAELTFTKNTDWKCANYCIDSKIIFYGDASIECATDSVNCEVYTYGKVGWNFGTFSKDSKFYSPHMKNLDIIKKVAGKSCKFYLIDEDGNHKKVLS